MQKKCDLYLCNGIRSERLKFVKIFDDNFSYDSERIYLGYLGINVNRIKLVSVVSDLKGHEIPCFSVPTIYRENENISSNQAMELANKYALNLGASVLQVIRSQPQCPPVYWAFGLKCNDDVAEKVGGVVLIDRIDGHVWTNSEYEEYMYDYNNIF